MGIGTAGARVRFEPVARSGKKQEYHGTVTVTRACKQQFLTQNPQVVNLKAEDTAALLSSDQPPEVQLQLQCAAPVPITTGVCARVGWQRCSGLQLHC